MASWNDQLHVDILSSILGFLHWKEILKARGVCKNWQEAVSRTVVPNSSFIRKGYRVHEYCVKNQSCLLALNWISGALPRLGTIDFGRRADYRARLKIREGVDTESHGSTGTKDYLAGRTPPIFDLNILGRFRCLQHLYMDGLRLVGSFPCLFDFPYLETLDVSWNSRLVWDLQQLQGLPNLRRMYCDNNLNLTGNVQSFQLVCNTIEDISLFGCKGVEGSFEHFYNFKILRKLHLNLTKVHGDIRTITPSDLVSLKDLCLSGSIWGGDGNLTSIADAPKLMQARYEFLKKGRPHVFDGSKWYLDRRSQDYSRAMEVTGVSDWCVEFVRAGTRTGWRWTDRSHSNCFETIWLEPEPSKSNQLLYEDYKIELTRLQQSVDRWRGHSEPPTRITAS